jgi:hypothetical protein
MKRTLGVAALGVALVLGTGCGAAADKAAERATEEAIEEAAGGGQVDIDDDGNVQVETEDGSFAANDGELPDDWPEDIPVIDGATVDSSFSTSSGGDTVTTAAMTTDKSVEEVLAFYKEELSGWTVDNESTSEFNGVPSGSLIASDGERTASIGATEASGSVTVSITYTAPSA